MKKQYWISAEAMLNKHGFSLNRQSQRDPETTWFVGTSADARSVTTHLRLTLKPKLEVVTAHIGWRHEAAHAFCLDALKSDWPSGFEWLANVGVLQAPCLLLFNLADYMEWPLAGMPISPQVVYESAAVRFGEALAGADWTRLDPESLLNVYVADQRPFGWCDANSAIRLAQIAGLLKHLERDGELFNRCAADHLALIEADMFRLGSARNWAQALRSRLDRR